VERGLLRILSFTEANDVTLVIKINNYPITCFFFSFRASFYHPSHGVWTLVMVGNS
jgi:hypothetical protein